MARAFSASVVSTTLCSGARNASGPISSRASGGVLGCGQVGVCARGPRRADSFSTCGPSAATTRRSLRHAVLVELVEVLDERVDRLAVLLVGLGMADADAEQEPAGVGRLDAVERLGDRPGVGRPDVDDAGGHLQRRRRRRGSVPPSPVRRPASRPTQTAP